MTGREGGRPGAGMAVPQYARHPPQPARTTPPILHRSAASWSPRPAGTGPSSLEPCWPRRRRQQQRRGRLWQRAQQRSQSSSRQQHLRCKERGSGSSQWRCLARRCWQLRQAQQRPSGGPVTPRGGTRVQREQGDHDPAPCLHHRCAHEGVCPAHVSFFGLGCGARPVPAHRPTAWHRTACHLPRLLSAHAGVGRLYRR